MLRSKTHTAPQLKKKNTKKKCWLVASTYKSRDPLFTKHCVDDLVVYAFVVIK